MLRVRVEGEGTLIHIAPFLGSLIRFGSLLALLLIACTFAFFYLPLSRPLPLIHRKTFLVCWEEFGLIWLRSMMLLYQSVSRKDGKKKNFFLLLCTTTEKIFLDMDPIAGGR